MNIKLKFALFFGRFLESRFVKAVAAIYVKFHTYCTNITLLSIQKDLFRFSEQVLHENDARKMKEAEENRKKALLNRTFTPYEEQLMPELVSKLKIEQEYLKAQEKINEQEN